MPLLRFLLLLPSCFIGILIRLCGRIVRPLLGSVSWTAPGWIVKTTASVKNRPRRFALRALICISLAVTAWYGWRAYQHRPHPKDLISLTVRGPEQTGYAASDGTPLVTVHPVEIRLSGSAAPIEMLGKPVASGITMKPALKGEWVWADDHTLRFTPAADWPVGAHVQVQFDNARVFSAHARMADDHIAFKVQPFVATFGTSEFYQDPRIEAAKKTIIALNFNYPVDAAQLEQRLALALIGRDGKSSTSLRYTVTYDAAKLNAWVHSQPLDLPRDDATVRLHLDDGVRSSRGGEGTKEAREIAVDVPGLDSLRVTQVSPTLVDNDRYEPEQVLLAGLTQPVRGADLSSRTTAWVLPERNPQARQADGDAPYAWSVDEVSEAVLKMSTPLAFQLEPTEDDYAPLQSFRYRATPGQRVYVRIENGLKSFGGYRLAQGFTQTFTVPAYPRLLRFVAEGSLLSLSGSKRISVVSRNLTGMKLEIGRVLPDQLQHFVSFNQGTYARPAISESFGEDHIVERFEEKRAFSAADPGKAHFEGFDLGQYLKAGKRGVFLLHLSAYDPIAQKKQDAAASESDTTDDSDNADTAQASEDDPGDTRLIVVTDLGLLVKRALDASQDVFVQSIRTGQPVEGATVSVLAVNGQPLFTQTTDASGFVHFPSFSGLDRDKRPELYIVKKGEDLSFLPIGGYDRQLNLSRFDVGGERNPTSAGELSAWLFSDRGIYRPGDTFHVGMIARAASWARSLAGVPLQAEVVDARGMTVKRQSISVDASGFTELTYTTAGSAPTGTWTVNLYMMKNGQATGEPIGSTTVQIKEFLPDQMKVEAKFSQQTAEGWVKPADLKGMVDAQNLFGTPAASRRVEASLTLRPSWPAFRSWQGYQFFDARRAQEGYTTALQDGKTDEHGHAEFDLDLRKYANASYQAYFLAKAYAPEGGRSVTASAQTLVSSNDWLLGVKSVDDLSYVTRGSPRKIRLVAIDSHAKPIELKGLRAQWVERRYVSVLTKQDSGAYKYESRLKEVPLEDKPFAIPAAGLDYALPTDKPGNFALVLRDADQTEVNRVDYSVAGEANVSRSLDRNAELQINLSKHDYAPGEMVEVAIRAPYAGSGLITVERDKVYSHAWFHADTTSSVQRIRVPADFEGNGYINVQYVRDPSSDEIFMSPLSYAVVPFSVNMNARRNALSVDAPALVKPGQTVHFKVHSAHASKVVVFAVDEGILQVARYKLKDPIGYFFRKRMLEVSTSQILDLILPEFAKVMNAAAPGGDGDDALGRQLNPFSRKRDNPAVYWSGIVDVDGDRTLDYTVPDDFNGKLRVMAVSVSPDLVGAYEGAVTVRGDFVLSPNVPTTLAPGDEAEVSVGVANNIDDSGGKAAPVSVTLKTGPQLQIIGAATQTLTLAPTHEGTVTYRVRANELPGSSSLSFMARHGDKTAQQTVEVSVRPASPYRTQIDVARVDAGARSTLSGLRAMYDAYASNDAAISTIPAVLSTGLASWLDTNEHAGSEPITSVALARVIGQSWPPATQALAPVQRRGGLSDSEALAQYVDTIRSRQNAQGGFGMWTATPDADPFISAYVMHALIDVRERGLAVPKDMIDAGNAYLQKLADDDRLNSLELLRQRAYAVYVLTREGNVTTNSLAAVQKRLQEAFPNTWNNDLAAAWLAASYALMKQDKAANQLIEGPQRLLERRSPLLAAVTRGADPDALTRDATTLYLLARHFPERTRNLSPGALENIAGPLTGNVFNTLSAAMTMLALDAYGNANADNLDKLATQAIATDGSAKDISSSRADKWRAGSWSAGVKSLRFVNGSRQTAWRVAIQSGYDRGSPDQPIKNGLEIVREYTDKNGEPVANITAGDELDVHVKIRAINDDSVGQIAIVDLLPGGFDPVLARAPSASPEQDGNGDETGEGNDDPPADAPSIGLPGSTWQPEHADVREDRVVIYGVATRDVREFVYRIKASNAGRFNVPPAYGESMTDRRIQARSKGGEALTVERAR